MSYDWVNVQRYADAPTLVDYTTIGPSWNGYDSSYGLYQYEDYVYQENYLELNPVSPSLETTPMHGDWVLNAFFSQLDDPNCVEVICIDTDAGNGSWSGFDDLWTMSDGSFGIYDVVAEAFNDFYSANDEYLIVGLNASFATTDPNASAAVSTLLSDGTFVVQASPNVTSPDIFRAWGNEIPNVINVGAWNVDLNDYSLAVNPTDYMAVDIYADGYTHNSSWNETSNFGTSFAAPVVLAEIVNYADEVLTPLIESGEVQPDPNAQITDGQMTSVVDGFVDAISTMVYVDTVYQGQTYTEVVKVLTDEVTDGDLYPTTVPISMTDAGYQIASASLTNDVNHPSEPGVETESNDSIADADLVFSGASISGQLSSSSDV
ncbi:MAG: hypothetical protein CBC12_02250, partial [Candidatus Puniceispirillum sp. TMED52]